MYFYTIKEKLWICLFYVTLNFIHSLFEIIDSIYSAKKSQMISKMTNDGDLGHNLRGAIYF